MSEAPALPNSPRGIKRPPPAPTATCPRPPTAFSLAGSKPIEIVAPDRYCADLLLQDAARLFPAELVAGGGWVVRLEPPPGGKWVLDVLALVERWLDSVPLPCAKVLYGDGSYLIRPSTGFGPSAVAAALAAAPATATQDKKHLPHPDPGRGLKERSDSHEQNDRTHA
jgi:hypothetical protein